MLLEYVARDDINRRQIAVMKLRENGYDGTNRAMLISDDGISIDGTMSIVHGDTGATIAVGDASTGKE